MTVSSNKFPQRLISVGRYDDQALRLLDTGGACPGPYAALSYSWGNAVITKTTTATIDEMKKHINLKDLQETIVDAIVLTRELGIEYLWVDSLCIVQDSKDDWERESSKMASLYANAIITFASVSSQSAAVPFLRHENSVYSRKHQERAFTQTMQTDSGPFVLKARLIEQSGIHWRWQSDSEQRSPKEPWAKRGWTLQEQVLSSRLLMISSTEMQWVCKQAETCECLSTLNRRRQFGRTPLAQLSDPGETFRFWHKLVENYSNRNLSDSSDKLPAISGIAEVVQQKTNSRYIAGLWEDNIDLDLLWHKTGDLGDGEGGDAQAPSFSWASVDGEVDYHCFRNGKLPYRASTEVLALETCPSLQVPLGRVTSGRLTMRGPMIASLITSYSDDDGWAAIKVADRDLEFIPDARLGYVMDNSDNAKRVACRRPRAGQAGIQPLITHSQDTKAAFALSPGVRCWLLKLGEFEPRRHKSAEWGAELMVLGQSVSRPGCFQRLGMVLDIVRGLNNHFGTDTISTITLV